MCLRRCTCELWANYPSMDEQVGQFKPVTGWQVRNLLYLLLFGEGECMMDESLPFHYQIGIDE